tara:strand:+ start:127 stop:543 length:417 start_codon:yes stop_codon:yes gene_type:complete
MSQFECLVKDLNGNPTEKNKVEKPESKNILSKGEYSINSHEHSNENPHMNSNENTGLNKFININSTIFNKLTDHKNIRVVLVVVISYLVTNSSQFIDLLGNSFPYLIEEGTTNLIGKLIIAILIGFSVVMFTSFFEVP